MFLSLLIYYVFFPLHLAKKVKLKVNTYHFYIPDSVEHSKIFVWFLTNSDLPSGLSSGKYPSRIYKYSFRALAKFRSWRSKEENLHQVLSVFWYLQRKEDKEGGGGEKYSRGSCSLSALSGNIIFKLFVFKEGREGTKIWADLNSYSLKILCFNTVVLSVQWAMIFHFIHLLYSYSEMLNLIVLKTSVMIF